MTGLLMEVLPYLIGAVMAAFGLGGLWKKAESAGKAKNEAEYAKHREAELARIRRADAARPSGGVHDDPLNRDHR